MGQVAAEVELAERREGRLTLALTLTLSLPLTLTLTLTEVELEERGERLLGSEVAGRAYREIWGDMGRYGEIQEMYRRYKET